jgi:transcriptional repressor NrdR
MRCPKCTSDTISVIDSRSDNDSIRRRRECQSCQFRFTTFERVELALPMVVKKDGSRQLFERKKILAGLIRACEKRPVSMDTIEKTVEELEQQIQERCAKEIESREVGDLVVEKLRLIDKIAYIRFASVYREFSDISQFHEALQSLDEAQRQQVVSRMKVANS